MNGASGSGPVSNANAGLQVPSVSTVPASQKMLSPLARPNPYRDVQPMHPSKAASLSSVQSSSRAVSVPSPPILLPSDWEATLKRHLSRQEAHLRDSLKGDLRITADILTQSHTKMINASNGMLDAQKKERYMLNDLAKAQAEQKHASSVVQDRLDELFDELAHIRGHLNFISAHLGVREYTVDGDEANTENKLAEPVEGMRLGSHTTNEIDHDPMLSRGASTDMDADGEPDDSLSTRMSSCFFPSFFLCTQLKYNLSFTSSSPKTQHDKGVLRPAKKALLHLTRQKLHALSLYIPHPPFRHTQVLSRRHTLETSSRASPPPHMKCETQFR